MHDPMGYLADLFAHEHLKFQYVHENEPDDSMFRGATNFQEAMDKIIDLEMKLIMYKYKKDLKTRIVGERGAKLKIKEDLQREKTEQEAREDGENYVVALVAQTKDKGKHVL